MKIRVIVFGATGMVGEGVLLKALNHEYVESVLVIGRRPCMVMHSKLKEMIHHDFFDYSGIEEQLQEYDACFFCLGVSSVGMNERDYSRITYGLTMQAATVLSRHNPAMTFCYVSGTGTDSTEQGRIMWARVKGRTENHLAKIPFKAVYSFRPGLLKPINGQRNVKPIFKALAWPYPLWKVLFPKAVSTIADVGLPPHAYLTQIRIREAKGFLKRGWKIVDTAYETGFSDQSHLSKHFKRIMGCTPGQYSNFIQDS